MSASPARTARNRRIAAARLRGESWASICAREGISERQARRAAKSGPQPAVDGSFESAVVDVEQMLARIVAEHEAALSDLARLARMSNPSAARVGAVKARASVALSLLEVLVAAGFAPERPDWSQLRQVHEAARAIYAMCQEMGFSAEQFERMWNRHASATPSLPPVAVDVGARLLADGREAA